MRGTPPKAACRGNLLYIVALLLPLPLSARPTVSYTLSVDASDLSRFEVTMVVSNSPDTLRLAFARHPEYDEQFWRNLASFTVESGGKLLPLVREDSALWSAPGVRGNAVVRCEFRLGKSAGSMRRAWKIFLRETGGLVGGPQSFPYIVGYERVPYRVKLDIPSGWQIATGLMHGRAPRTFIAANVDELVDSPLLIGNLQAWSFRVEGVTHRVVYWPLPDAVPFDTAKFVGVIEKIVRAAAGIFGRLPYREYLFLVQDGAGDALEHLNSLTIGARSSEIARDMDQFAGQLAHEFFHTWNLVRIRPAEQMHVTYMPPTPTADLWWSEGVTLYYANKLLHRAGLADSAQMMRWLTTTIAGYIQNPGNWRISPEQASLWANGLQIADSGYRASYYTQGTVLGQMLDIAIRDSTRMRRGLDDVMRLLNRKFSRSKGFRDTDIEKTVDAVCGCDVHQFFEDHVRGTKPPDIERFLRSIGLHMTVRRETAADSSGRPLPDMRVFGFVPEGGNGVRISVFSGPNAWWRSGLRSGDDVIMLNDDRFKSAEEFRGILSRQRVGDSLVVAYRRGGAGVGVATVHLTPYEAVRVTIEKLPSPDARQREMYRRWILGGL